MNTERETVLLSRVVDQCADEGDFDQLGRIASEDPGVWERLGLTLRDHAVLRGALASALAPCARVALPSVGVRRPRVMVRRALQLAGALVLVALVFLAGRLTVAAADADRLLADYLRVGSDSGRILQELPVVPVSSEPTADGRSLEVVFVRPLLERAVVDKAWRLGVDDHGQVVPSEVSIASCRQPSSF